MNCLRICIFLFLFFTANAFAENEVAILKPYHRTADELQPILQKIAGDSVTIQSFNNKLVVSGESSAVEGVRKALAQLDTKSQNLRIELKRQEAGSSESEAYGASGQVILKKNTAGVRYNPRAGAANNSGANAEIRSGGSRIQMRANRTNEGSVGSVVATVLVRSGGEGLLRSPEGDLSQSWRVKPILQGENITLEVQAQKEFSGLQPPPTSAVSSLQTSRSGKLGQWMELGQSSKATAVNDSAMLDKSQARSHSRYIYFIRAVLATP